MASLRPVSEGFTGGVGIGSGDSTGSCWQCVHLGRL